jgi:SsrA-binding protein
MSTKQQIRIKNKKAEFEYFILQKYTAGIVLTGTEIKSIRQGKVNLTDSYCRFLNGELWVSNMHIAEYSHGGHYNHDPKADRKLLLSKKELRKLEWKVTEKGTTIIPLVLWMNEKGYAKLDIALAKGKRQYDKRETIKDRDNDREMQKHIR